MAPLTQRVDGRAAEAGVFEVRGNARRDVARAVVGSLVVAAVALVVLWRATISEYGYLFSAPRLHPLAVGARKVVSATRLTLTWPDGQGCVVEGAWYTPGQKWYRQISPDRAIETLSEVGAVPPDVARVSEPASMLPERVIDEAGSLVRAHRRYARADAWDHCNGLLLELEDASGDRLSFVSIWSGPSRDDCTACCEFVLRPRPPGQAPGVVARQRFNLDTPELSTFLLITVCPMWAAGLVFAGAMPIVGIRERRRRTLRAGRCPACGYDLRRLPTRRCPECGGHWTAFGGRAERTAAEPT